MFKTSRKPIGLMMGFLLWAASVSPVFAATPADILLLQEVIEIEAMEFLPPEKEKLHTEKLISLVLEQVDSIAKARDYPDWFRADNPLIVRLVRARVMSDGKKLKRLTVDAVSGRLAEDAIANAAGAPSLPSGVGTGRVSLGNSATATGGGPLALDLDASFIEKDKGSIGSGNGALDAGEFANLHLVFKNVSNSRLMSSSIYLVSMSECLWSPSELSKEEELSELMPGESASIFLQVYLSSACRSRSATLTLHAFDSHAFPRTPLVFRVVFPAADIGDATLLTRVRIDSDDYGFSEPSQADPLQPEDRVELSAGLRLGGSGWNSVNQVFTVPTPLKSSHSPATTKPTYSSSTGASTARVVDDVDIEVPVKVVLERGLQEWARFYGWKTPEDAKLFVAVDSVMTRGAEPTAAAPPSADSVASGGGTRVDRAKVERVLTEHVGVEPVVRRGKGGGGGTLVTVDGFRVYVEDPDALMSALEGIAPSTTSTSAGKQTQGKQAPVRASTRYQVRHYIELPIAWTPEAPPPPPSCFCSIAGSSKATTVEEQAKLRAVVQNCSPDASIKVLYGGEEYALTETAGSHGSRSGFVHVTEDKPGDFDARVEVRMGKEVICASRTLVRFKLPPAPDKYVLRWSIEPRLLLTNLADDTIFGGGLLATVGKDHRFVFGWEGAKEPYSQLSPASGNYTLNRSKGPLLGYRFSGPYKTKADEPYFEISPQVLLGVPYIVVDDEVPDSSSTLQGRTMMLRPGLQFAFHPQNVGVFGELGTQLFPLTNLSSTHFYVAGGLGFYFGK